MWNNLKQSVLKFWWTAAFNFRFNDEFSMENDIRFFKVTYNSDFWVQKQFFSHYFLKTTKQSKKKIKFFAGDYVIANTKNGKKWPGQDLQTSPHHFKMSYETIQLIKNHIKMYMFSKENFSKIRKFSELIVNRLLNY